MRITLKISLLTTAWMLLTLIIINIIVFILFMKTTVDMEKDTTIQKADDIVKYFQAETDYTPEQINSKLKALLTEHSYIRILQADNQVLYEVTNEKPLAEKIKGKYVDTQESERRGISLAKKEKQVLIVRVPLKEGLNVKGSLEIGKELIGLESRKDILLWILGVSSLLAVILSLLSGRWLANIIMRPITNMIQTMEDIERSGIPKKIIIHSETRDELQTLANTFNLMIDRLEENFEKQSQFVSDASHELKTPLTVIKSYANLLRRHGLKDQEMADEAIQAIHTEATRIQKMTETFLDVASLEKEVELEMNLVNLVSLCQSILKQLKHVYKRDIILHFEESPILILADELKIKQVIIILLDNAIKYSNKNIDVFLKKMEGNAIVCVEDHGIGIPQEEIENIFERFYRVDKARSRETGGSGLGLHIANRIVKLHKGEITLKSKEGEGTKVILHLPAGLELL
ncbi:MULTISPECIES: sensor histidine kinase [Mesobacillus]|uniref:Signal transduction histidine-protein kinase ArlS n=2 Tax=Mesobacillus TaxID=2675231 RepID=A0A0D6ZDI2_9BACI|nr:MULTISPECIES: ATP-binding protein [Mesobacillus]KIY23330.1 histidine kinase [Mesobacillus subterraneus]MDQ0413208.1 signal transduction histidine kinase [Mesobacillus stamsii]